MRDNGAPDDDRGRRFTDLFHAHHGAVVAFARRRLGPELADDAVAETLLTAWRRLDDLDPDDHALPWLYTIAGHAVANQRRAAKRRVRLDERARTVLREPSRHDHADDVVEADALTRAFLRLDEKDREVLRLTSWEGLGPDEAAAVVGCSRTAFGVRLHRARRRLESLIAHAYPADVPPAAHRPLATTSEETTS